MPSFRASRVFELPEPQNVFRTLRSVIPHCFLDRDPKATGNPTMIFIYVKYMLSLFLITYPFSYYHIYKLHNNPMLRRFLLD